MIDDRTDDSSRLSPDVGSTPAANIITGGSYGNVVQSQSIDSLTIGNSVEAVRASRFLDCYVIVKDVLTDVYEIREKCEQVLRLKSEQARVALESDLQKAVERLTVKKARFESTLYALEPLCNASGCRFLEHVHVTAESMAHASEYVAIMAIWGGFPPGYPVENIAPLHAGYRKLPDMETHRTVMLTLLERLKGLLVVDGQLEV
ncbi:hypothetical protein [Saccharothrix saharensis]|uniref:hypothetical protein n=1 Tax=Saccharothrix saharensis TaxID=571190 RepID=UPI001151AED7|nr:hypothetical protein [Saccharothrix saharensis]